MLVTNKKNKNFDNFEFSYIENSKITFDYFYNSPYCNRELCKFYNDAFIIKDDKFNSFDYFFDLFSVCKQFYILENKINHLSKLLKKYKKKVGV